MEPDGVVARARAGSAARARDWLRGRTGASYTALSLRSTAGTLPREPVSLPHRLYRRICGPWGLTVLHAYFVPISRSYIPRMARLHRRVWVASPMRDPLPGG